MRFNQFYGAQIHADFQDLIPLSAFICENLRPISHYAYWGTTLLITKYHNLPQAIIRLAIRDIRAAVKIAHKIAHQA